jgi:hypothetical protein
MTYYKNAKIMSVNSFTTLCHQVAAIACRENKLLGHGEVLKSFCIGLKGSPDIAAAEQVQ